MKKVLFSLAAFAFACVIPNASFALDPVIEAFNKGELTVDYNKPEVTAKINKLVKGGGSINAGDADGRTILMLAAMKHNGSDNRVDDVYLYVGLGADPNIKDKNGFTALMHVAVSNVGQKWQMERALLESKADPEIKKDGMTALLLAAKANTAVDTLIKYGANPKVVDPSGQTALMYAVKTYHNTNVTELINKGVDINARDNEGRTALHIAIESGNVGLCRTLLDKKANPNIVANNGYTPLMMAATTENESLVKTFMDAGADASILPKGLTLAEVVANNPRKNQILTILGSLAKVPMPKGYSINPTIMKNAKAKAKEFSGDKFVDIVFLEPSLRPFKSTKWPHPITHYSMKVGYITKDNGKYIMTTTNVQVYNNGDRVEDIRFQSSMSGGAEKVEVDYK